MELILASKSPRRRELFALISPHFAVEQAEIEEDTAAGETAVCLAQRLAGQKAADVFVRRPNGVVIGCDTVVELGGETLGKPPTQHAARQMLRSLSGRQHFVHTGVVILASGGRRETFAETTAVDFLPIPAQEIDAYLQTGEPYDKAGGYGIQGWAARYVAHIEGCYYNVMGLPVARLYHALRQKGFLPAPVFSGGGL